jgi:hypothetical protein
MLLGKQGGKRAEGEMLRADAGDACPAHADGGGSFSSGTRRTDASPSPFFDGSDVPSDVHAKMQTDQ